MFKAPTSIGLLLLQTTFWDWKSSLSNYFLRNLPFRVQVLSAQWKMLSLLMTISSNDGPRPSLTVTSPPSGSVISLAAAVCTLPTREWRCSPRGVRPRARVELPSAHRRTPRVVQCVRCWFLTGSRPSLLLENGNLLGHGHFDELIQRRTFFS